VRREYDGSVPSGTVNGSAAIASKTAWVVTLSVKSLFPGNESGSEAVCDMSMRHVISASSLNVLMGPANEGT
jgi:hypothetical protein